MVGAYPDPPNHRLQYDRDGTTVLGITSSDDIKEISDSVRQRLNDEGRSEMNVSGNFTDGGSLRRLVFLFPEPIDLSHYLFVYEGDFGASDPGGSLESSNDTTNGVDGTWSTVISSWSWLEGAVRPRYRSQFGAAEALGVKAIRFNNNPTIYLNDEINSVHLYGVYSSAAPALQVWDPDSDQRIAPAHLDWGDAQRGTTATKRFRVKNTSTSEDAIGVTLSTNALTDPTPSNPGQHDFSDDGGASFADPLDIGDLAAGEISGELLLRRDLQSDAALGVWALRILAEATSWSEVS